MSAAMNERLRLAYVNAREEAVRRHLAGDLSHVQIHAGADLIEYLKSLATHLPKSWPAKPTLWGFTLVEADEKLGADHLPVHTVTVLA